MEDLKIKKIIKIVMFSLWELKIFMMLENHIKTLIKSAYCTKFF